MREEQGWVVERRGERALVRIPGGGPCAECAAAGTCRPEGGEGYRSVEALNPMGAGPGQRVALGIPPGARLRANLTRYLLPAAGLLAGAALVQGAAGLLVSPEAAGKAAAIGGAACALIGLAAARRLAARQRGRSLPRITRILDGGPGP